jgi:hypothetical protein
VAGRDGCVHAGSAEDRVIRHLRVSWNWKSALVSAVCRAIIFFIINAQAGLAAGLAAMQVEFSYRVIASGFYGALTQYFAQHPNPRVAWATALILLPVLAHSVEFIVHSWAGTPLLGWSMAGSILFSVATTRLHLIAMHRGVMTVGPGSQSLAADLRALPATLAAFFGIALRG